MKTFYIPAVFIVKAEDATAAEELAGSAQQDANIGNRRGIPCFCVLDELLPTVEVTLKEGEEVPYTLRGTVLP